MKAITAISTLCFLLSCSPEPVKNMKDLEQSMMDLKAYQENLGEGIRACRLEDSRWLLDGMDSTLRTVAATITEHHRMDKPFAYYKKRLLDKPLSELESAFDDNDTAKARAQYVILVDKCNKCHLDLEIDKEVKY
ncbi:MAG: hypothetical protein K0Q66_1385 [Chitinophagaceae bacterium]|jgi:hypothetical protein|nr:hypothetical protein [Chitinophagaceae bacterium]